MSFLSNLRLYAGSWGVTSREKISAEDKAAIASAEVVESQYGPSVCFHLKSGGTKFLPVSRDTDCKVGQSVNLDNAEILTLSREGDDDIYRIEF